ncbi:MAG: hypothetical protein WCO63_08215 [Bacteroidota bacterium]
MNHSCGCGGHHHSNTDQKIVEVAQIEIVQTPEDNACCGGPEISDEDCCKTSASGKREGEMVGKETGCGCGC